MVDKFEVINCGTDSSGRTIWMTRYMKGALDAVKADWRVKPFAEKIVVTQGAFMTRDGGGATASAGYHDLAGCVDFRIWNLTEQELDIFIYVLRCYGFAAWRRTAAHGWTGEEHAHATLGGDSPYSIGARASWISYQSGNNGLANNAADYERRPSPIVTAYTGPLTQPEDDALTPEDRDFIKNQFDDLQARLFAARTADKERAQKLIGKFADLKKAVAKLPKSAASKQEVQDLLESLDVEFKVVVGDDGTPAPAAAESRPHEESN